MKSLIAAAVALLGLAGCIAVPGPYGPDVYYAAPAVGVAVYPGYGSHRGHGYGHGHGRHYRGHGRRH